ncbi:MAG TPA: outer membrane protein assembly factor BamD [Pyrinomonadaceae bacterium]|jgi:outer membrane protein assembly factor BamD|nr:outer membrane protein assembly factor BamD [Pyrinomonadaceae bacterium]
MYFRRLVSIILGAILLSCLASVAVLAQGSDATPVQRLDVMKSKLNTMQRSLNNAISSINAKESEGAASADDPRTRLRGLEQEVSAVLTEVLNARSKLDRSERLDPGQLDRLETSVADLNTRTEAGLQSTASARSAAASAPPKKKKKKGFLGLFGGGGDDKYEELTGTVAPGRDRVLFEEAAKEVRKSNYETGRLLFNTIITTYPDSTYLPMAKLAIADSFYLEGFTSSLIQAAAAYQDWLTFFPTHPLADDVMLKIAESDMRQMGLPDRQTTNARKAEQRLKVLLQQFPDTPLRDAAERRLKEVQENLAMHNLQVARFYYSRNEHGNGGLRGAQSRLREIVEKYPYFTYMDEVLYRLGDLYVQEEEPDEAAKFYQQVVRDWPNSEYAEKAKDQLTKIGAAIPDPDPIKQKMPPPARPGTMQKVMAEVLGTIDVTVNKNGVLISKDDKSGSDLIDVVLRNQGELPSNATPNAPSIIAPVQRTPPARPVIPQNTAPPTRTNTQTGGGAGALQATPAQASPAPPTASPATPPPAIKPPTVTPSNTTTPPTTPAGTQP